MSEKEKRTIYPVIVTDRVVDAERSFREWELSDTLICRELPVGFDGCERPIYVVVNNPAHMASLLSFGVALAHQAVVKEGDFEFGIRENSGLKAYEAENRRGKANQQILEDWRKELLPPELAQHLLSQLMTNTSHCKSFSTDWIYASLIYASSGIRSLHPYEAEIKKIFFGKKSSTPGLDATDRDRGKKYFIDIFSQTGRKPFNVPKDSQLVRPLTRMLLEIVLPQMLRTGHSLNIDCDIKTMSRAPRRDIKLSEEFNHEQIQRSSGTVPFTSFCT